MNPATKRGRKRQRDFKQARNQAFLAGLMFLCHFVLFVWLRFSSNEDDIEGENDVAVYTASNCLDNFDIAHGVYLGVLFLYMAFRSKIGCVR